MSQQEQPWQPGPNDLPFTTHLISPHGDRHLGFNEDEGRYYRLWQHKSHEQLHTGEAIFLRPSDINEIISFPPAAGCSARLRCRSSCAGRCRGSLSPR
ncbi:hypothetical protein [Streptomyces sp. NPDC058295]|uniref:hypothetical protein n=1 Tax=Streptomyces sp. NPDC058295 TaxID=3346431 RepID=UPI0036ED6C78